MDVYARSVRPQRNSKGLCHGILALFLFRKLYGAVARIARVWQHMPETGVVAVAAIPVPYGVRQPAGSTHTHMKQQQAQTKP